MREELGWPAETGRHAGDIGGCGVSRLPATVWPAWHPCSRGRGSLLPLSSPHGSAHLHAFLPPPTTTNSMVMICQRRVGVPVTNVAPRACARWWMAASIAWRLGAWVRGHCVGVVVRCGRPRQAAGAQPAGAQHLHLWHALPGEGCRGAGAGAFVFTRVCEWGVWGEGRA